MLRARVTTLSEILALATLRQLVYPLYKHFETRVHPLRVLFIEITQRCNLECRHCGSDCSKDTKTAELSTEEWLNFFSYLGKNMDTRKTALILTGGEPTCHPDFDTLVRGLHKNNLTWAMVTNGFHLPQKRIDLINRCGIISATVSLDGLEKNHDWLRGRKGAFKRALVTIDNLLRAQKPFFDVVTCVHPGNLPELPRILELLCELGVEQWRLFSIFPKGRAAQNRELLLGPKGFKALMEFISHTRTVLKKSLPRVLFSCEGYLPEAWDRQVRDDPYFCRAGISIGSVLCDGSISACPNISRQLVQGNIRDDDLLSVWESRYQKFRNRDWMKKGPCEHCNQWNSCKGNSIHLWDENSGHTALCTYEHVSDLPKKSL